MYPEGLCCPCWAGRFHLSPAPDIWGALFQTTLFSSMVLNAQYPSGCHQNPPDYSSRTTHMPMPSPVPVPFCPLATVRYATFFLIPSTCPWILGNLGRGSSYEPWKSIKRPSHREPRGGGEGGQKKSTWDGLE